MYPVIYCRATASNQVLDLLGILMGLLGMFNGFGFLVPVGFWWAMVAWWAWWWCGGDWVVWLLRE